jgi:class 3 adenylate cyclase
MSDVAVLFVDVVHSTALYEKVGNQRARQTVGGYLGEVATVVASQGGRVVKSMGDGLLCAFPEPDKAVGSALVMRERAPGFTLGIRVGIDSGEVLDDAGDIFGDAVNTAARIAGVAKPNEILISKTVHDALPEFMRNQVRPVQPVIVKGKREPLTLYSILEGAATGTVAAVAPMGMGLHQTSMIVSYGEGSCVVDGDHSEIRLGREPDNDLVVQHRFASRHHARISYRGGKFRLADESANGTFLVFPGNPIIVLRREEALLLGSGEICLGEEPSDESGDPVRFRPA